MKKLVFILILLVGAVELPINVFGQSDAIDRDLLSEILKIKAIDNHAHPLKYVAPGEKPDDEYDALPLDAIGPIPLTVRLHPDNLEFVEAWRDLYGYKHDDMSEAHQRELLQTKQRVATEQGDKFPAWVLDQLSIETMFANRVAMGRGLTAPRFRWVSFVDALLFPLSNETAKKSNRDYAGFYPVEEKLLKRYLNDLQLKDLPATLDDYTTKVVTATLERQKQQGVIALKFEANYLRLLDFEKPDPRKAADVYSRFVRGGEPSPSDYKALQDFLFHHIAKEAGRLGLAIHIHMLFGAGGYYRATGGNPLLLEPTFNDPELRKTTFVIVHGGYPYTQEVGSMFG